MEKEIYDQPKVLDNLSRLVLPSIKPNGKTFILGCGTASYAAAFTDYLFDVSGVDTEAIVGSEFAKYFDEALDILSITHKWSRPHSPKVNGYVERFNGVIQKEFIDYHVDLGIIDKPLFDQKLSEWVDWYNTRRPHWALGLISPLKYIVSTLSVEKSQMCWTSTGN